MQILEGVEDDMCWFKNARQACERRGYEMISFETEGWYIFLKKDGVMIPVTEEGINKWITEDME